MISPIRLFLFGFVALQTESCVHSDPLLRGNGHDWRSLPNEDTPVMVCKRSSNASSWVFMPALFATLMSSSGFS